jgi:D-3-phosphoglycerate dehydrogenase
MDARAFAAMKRGAYFINASRGCLVDESALMAALDSGHLAGAAIDVGRVPDQMPSPAVARHPHVLATPHIGGLTPPAIEHQALEAVGQTAVILQGRIPAGAVNAAHATRILQGVRAWIHPLSPAIAMSMCMTRLTRWRLRPRSHRLLRRCNR